LFVGADDAVGMLRRDRAHQRRIAGIAVAAAPNTYDELGLALG